MASARLFKVSSPDAGGIGVTLMSIAASRIGARSRWRGSGIVGSLRYRITTVDLSLASPPPGRNLVVRGDVGLHYAFKLARRSGR
jgi:hypothetical protein